MSKITEPPSLGVPGDRGHGGRSDALSRARRIELLSLSYNVVESGIGIAAGLAAGSVALLGFGLDAVVESASAGVLLWRLETERRGSRTAEEAERRAVRLVSFAFGALALYVGVRAGLDLAVAVRPDESTVGIVLAVVSLLVMPALARAKRRAARVLDSRALEGDSAQTMLCTYMSAALLGGLLANSLLGWWWADPIAGLVIAALAAKEARELWVTEDFCCS